MDQKLVAQAWNSFSQEVLGDVSEVQRQEMEKAFYAGATGFMSIMLKTSELPEDNGAQIVESARQELSDYFNGKATRPKAKPKKKSPKLEPNEGGVSLKLKACMKKIESAMRHYDVGGYAMINDGIGNNEFRLHFTPSWSQIELIEGALKFKVRMSSKPENTEKTVNLIYCMQDLLGQNWLMVDEIKKMIDKNLDVETDSNGQITPDLT